MTDANPICAPIEGVNDVFVPAILKQYMALLYMQAVPDLTMDQALESAVATWETEWDDDPEPRTYEHAREAVVSDLQHWDDD